MGCPGLRPPLSARHGPTSCPACAAETLRQWTKDQQVKSPIRHTHRAKSHRLGLHEQSKQKQSKRTRQTSPPKINESENIINVISNVISIISNINNRTDRNSKTSASLCSRNIVNRNKGRVPPTLATLCTLERYNS